MYFFCSGVRSITDSYVTSLYIALNDHNNETLLQHFAKSQIKCLRAAAEEEGIDLENVDMTEGERYSSKVLTSLWLCNTMDINVAKELKKAVELFKMLMSIKVVDLTSQGKRKLNKTPFLEVPIDFSSLTILS